MANARRVKQALTMIAVGAMAVGLIIAQGGTAYAATANVSPNVAKWMDPLPIPPVAVPQVNEDYDGADYYEITETQQTHQFHSQLGLATVRTYGENGKTPVMLGPTILATRGKPTVIKFINKLPTEPAFFPLLGSIDLTIPGGDLPTGRAVPHLHGGFVAGEYDGTPDQWWTADGIEGMDYFSDTYIYTNDQPASLLWYHDHAMGITRHNPYLGLAAGYLLQDSVDDVVAGKINGQDAPTLPYHIPLIIQDKSFNADGTLFYPTVGLNAIHPVWVPEFFGDVSVVNGKAYPYLNVEPRRYRFRLLNGSQARFYNLKLASNKGKALLPLHTIGSEGGLLPAPVPLTQLLIAPGERFDVIVDFTGLAGSIWTLKNDAKAPYPNGQGGDCAQLIQIRVNQPLTGTDTSVNPAALTLPAIAPLTATSGIPPRDIVMQEMMDMATGTPVEVLLNGKHYMDPVTDFVKAGSTEVWQFINLTGDAHPMHTHLVQFQVVDRQAINVAGYTLAWDNYKAGLEPKPVLTNFLVGAPIPPAPEETGFKDTVKVYPGQVARIIAKFDLPSTSDLDNGSYGKWVYHCHILEHEENDMMQPFEVVP